MKHLLTSFTLAGLLAAPAAAQYSTAEQDRPTAAPSQDYCISVMSGFPSDGIVPRYQFFKLTQQMAVDATPEFKAAMVKFGDEEVDPNAPILEVIESIANPVIRQAAPELTVSYMAHLIDFAGKCSPYIEGQVTSLTAYDASLALDDHVIQEDALYLRQILSDSMMRLGADTDAVTAPAVAVYAQSLISMRDNIEFTAYAADIDEIEALYMSDLDGRLARSNDIINEEMDREVLGDAVELSDDMNKDAKRKDDQNTVGTLLRILSRF